MTRMLVLVVVLCCASPSAFSQERPQDISIPFPKDSGYRLVGKLGEPPGTVLTVQGIVVDGPFKGGGGGPNLRVRRINGTATQEHIQIQLTPFYEEFGPKLKYGETYEFEGYETGAFSGIPPEAYRRLELKGGAVGFQFRHSFKVYRGKRIDPIVWSPADFVDRTATISGCAQSVDGRAYVVARDWRLLTDSGAPWPADISGKLVEATGTIRKTDDAATFRRDQGTSQLVRLEDQVGRQVQLRGKVSNDGVSWWFYYRGAEIYLGEKKKMPDWPQDLHFKPVSISGILEEGTIPPASRDDPTIVTKHFIVRKAAWKRIDALKSFETEKDKD
ncbi:MAG: hypothetical protein JWN70_4269 [Planctomycetaceae bacterium]|nr:hypothetical protein [Planctomycetaceae bacterium]